MKLITCTITTLMCHFAHASVETDIQNYLKIAEQKQLHQDITWQRLMYADQSQKSEVTYDGYFYAKDGKNNLKNEVDGLHDISDELRITITKLNLSNNENETKENLINLLHKSGLEFSDDDFSDFLTGKKDIVL